jgi:hypothetical protein
MAVIISHTDGARWSFTNQPYTNEYMVAMQGLTYAKIGIDNANEYLSAPYQEKSELLAYVQGGVKIQYLCQTLFQKSLTLSTSGTTDGQTLAGAVNTGTHNATLQFGSLHDSIRAIHLIIPDHGSGAVGSSKTVLLQKQSDAVVTPAYALDVIGADCELVSNDDLFHAALVSVGTFGIVHAFLIEVEPLFKLRVQVRNFPFSQVADRLYRLDDITSMGFDLNGNEIHGILKRSCIHCEAVRFHFILTFSFPFLRILLFVTKSTIFTTCFFNLLVPSVVPCVPSMVENKRGSDIFYM